MATAIQRRRGTTVQHQTFTGQVAEITVDTTKKTAVIHDGVTAGGFPLAREDNVDAAIVALNNDKLDKAGGTITGNLNVDGSSVLGDAADDTVEVKGATWTFSALATRIKGDFSNGTISNRAAFQSSVVNGVTVITILPNGTNVNAAVQPHNSSDPTNASFANLQVSATEVSLQSSLRGTAPYLPMTFYTGGQERVRLTPNGDARPYYTNDPSIAAGNTFLYSVGTHGQVCLITVSGSGTITFGAPANITEGAMYKFILKAGDTSGRTFAWNAAFKFPSATSLLTSGSTTIDAYDTISFIGGAGNTLIYDGHQADLR